MKPKTTTSLRLPTAAAFRKLPLDKRRRVFARWLAAQPKRKTYVYYDNSACVLAQFGKAIFRNTTAHGGASGINPEYTPHYGVTGPSAYIEVLGRGHGGMEDECRQALTRNQTFARASQRLETALKS